MTDEMDDLLDDDVLDEAVNFTDESLREVPEALKPEVNARLKAMGKIKKKNERLAAFTKFASDFAGKVSDVGIKSMKKAVLPMLPLLMLCLLAVGARAGVLGSTWDDLRDNSHINLGKNVAYGVINDFVLGGTYHGAKFSIWNYRSFHFEYGLMDEFVNANPISHSLGGSIYVRPFFNWARVPDGYSKLRDLYIGPIVRYDLHKWGAGLQVHLSFGSD